MDHVKDFLLLLWNMVPPQDHDDGSEKMSIRHYKWRKAITLSSYLLMGMVAVVVWWGAARMASAGDIDKVLEAVKDSSDQIATLKRRQDITEVAVEDQRRWQMEERRRNLERTVTELQVQRCRAKQPLRDIFGKQFDQAWAAYRDLPNADGKFVPPTCTELG